MFGFLKKKKKDKDVPEENSNGKTTGNEPDQESGNESVKPKKKKRSIIKLILIILLCLIAVGGSGFTVYKLWFSAPTDGQAPVYTESELPHVNLPEEMLKFSFDHYPDLYKAMIEFNREIDLFDKEIERIEQIAVTYPDQNKIVAKEKKIWVKAKDTLKKTFLKVEKPVKETYVQFRVNKELGLIQIEEKSKELTQTAQEALVTAQNMTEKLKQQQKVPEGLINGTLYKLKKKFL